MWPRLQPQATAPQRVTQPQPRCPFASPLCPEVTAVSSQERHTRHDECRRNRRFSVTDAPAATAWGPVLKRKPCPRSSSNQNTTAFSRPLAVNVTSRVLDSASSGGDAIVKCHASCGADSGRNMPSASGAPAHGRGRICQKLSFRLTGSNSLLSFRQASPAAASVVATPAVLQTHRTNGLVHNCNAGSTR